MSSSLTDSRMSGDDESQSGSAAPPELPASIASVWEHPFIEKKTWTDEGGNAHKTWTCLAEGCRKTWNGHNSTKALAHGSKLATFCLKHNVRPCKGRPSAEEVKLFTDLCARKMAAKSAKRTAETAVDVDIADSQDQVSRMVSAKKKKPNSSAENSP